MKAHLELAVGGDGVGASVGVRRDPAPDVHRRWWITLLLLVLTLPFTIALTANAIGYSLNAGEVLPAWLYGAGAPGFGRLLALGPPLALLILVVLRVRVHAGRSEGRWVGAITARLAGWELVVALLALAVAFLFFGHLVADSIACANGVKTAC